MADVPVYSAFVALATHIPFNILFIYKLEWGYLGAAVAEVFLYAIQPILLYIYLCHTNHGKNRIMVAIGADEIPSFTQILKEAISWNGIIQYLSLALPGIIAYADWWAHEVTTLLCARLYYPYSPHMSVDGMGIYQYISSFIYMSTIGVESGVSIRVSNFLGRNDPGGAQRAFHAAMMVYLVISVMLGIILYLSPHTLFPSMFTTDQDIIQEVANAIPLLTILLFVDGFQGMLSGVIEGCGRQYVFIPIVIVAYWMVGLPAAYYLAFVKNPGGEEISDNMNDPPYFSGINGLIAGLGLGSCVQMLVLLVIVKSTNWDAEAKKAQEMHND